MPTTCSACGAPLEPAARFCTTCGAARQNPEDATRANPRRTPAAGDDWTPTAPISPYAPGAPQSGEEPTAQYPVVPSAPAPQPTPPAPWEGQPREGQQWEERPAPRKPSRKPSRKPLVALIVLLVLLLAGAGFGGWWFFLRDDRGGPGDAQGENGWSRTFRVPEAIDSQPTQAWSWPVPEDTYLSASGNRLFTFGQSGIKLFDDGGQPVWSTEAAEGLLGVDSERGLAWASANEGKDSVLLDLETGEVKHTFKDMRVSGPVNDDGDGLAFKVDEESQARSASVVSTDGTEVFALPAFDVVGSSRSSMVTATEEGSLELTDLSTGTSVWKQSIKPWEDGEGVRLTVYGDHVAVREATRVTIRSLADGAVANETEIACEFLVPIGDLMVGCAPEGDPSGDPTGITRDLTLLDASGTVGRLENAELSSLQVVENGGTTYLVDSYEGRVWDTSLREVWSAPEDVATAATDSGLYVLDGDTLSFHTFSGEEKWSVAVPPGSDTTEDEYDYPRVSATDDLVAVLKDKTLTAWKR